MRNLVSVKTSATQHRVQLGSTPFDGPRQHKWPLTSAGKTSPAGFGLSPPASTMGKSWEIKHLRDSPDFMFPEKQHVGPMVFWPCTVPVLGACGEMRVLRSSKGQSKSFSLLATVIWNQEEI